MFDAVDWVTGRPFDRALKILLSYGARPNLQKLQKNSGRQTGDSGSSVNRGPWAFESLCGATQKNKARKYK